MKKILLPFLLLIFVTNISLSSDRIPCSEAKDHVGETLSVYGFVVDVFTSKSGNVYINFDKKFPRNTFTAVIFKKDLKKIQAGYGDEIISLIGKTLTVNGKIETYNEKPQIVIKKYSQIEGVSEEE